MTIKSGIQVKNNTTKTIRIRLSQVGPLHEAIIRQGESFHFDRIGNVFFTLSVEECLDETKRLTKTEIALPILATVLGCVGGTALLVAGLAGLTVFALPTLGVGVGTGVTVGSGIVVGSSVSGTGVVVGNTAVCLGSGAVGSGLAVGTGLSASAGVGIGCGGVAVSKGIALGTATVATATSATVAVTSTTAAVGGGLVPCVGAFTSGLRKYYDKCFKKDNKQHKFGEVKKNGVRSNGTLIDVNESNDEKFTITKL